MKHLLVYVLMVAVSCCCDVSLVLVRAKEWVEKAQRPKNEPKRKINLKILSETTTDLSVDLTAPSPEWIEYQRERFGSSFNNNNNNNERNPQKVRVSTQEESLKNDARIEPRSGDNLQLTFSKTTEAHNKVVHSGTNRRANSSNAIKIPAATQHPPRHMESTSREYHCEDEPLEWNGGSIEWAETETNKDECKNPNANQVQYPSLQGFMKFLKSMKKNWLKTSKFSIEDKFNVLKKLRDNLKHLIEQQFTALWKQPDETKNRRLKRGILEESHLQFPPEAALMSINFLTFAVFLIKLVMQIVHIIRSRHFSFSGFNVNTNSGKLTTHN